MNKIWSIVSVLPSAGMALVSCEKVDEKEEGPLTLNCEASLRLSCEAGQSSISFTCKGEWTAFSSHSWLSVSPESGSSNGERTSVTLSYGDNEGPKSKTASVTIISGDQSKTITVTQTTAIVTIPDPAFNAYCLENFDKDYDGELTMEEAGLVSSIVCVNAGIKSLEGITAFKNLQVLFCSDNLISELDISLPLLKSMVLSGNPLTHVTVTGCPSLEKLRFESKEGGPLQSLTVRSCSSLTEIYCSNNQLTTLDVSMCPALARLECYTNHLTTLDVSDIPSLVSLNCIGNLLSELNVSGCTHLEELECGKNQLPCLDVSGCTDLKVLRCDKNQLATLDVSHNPLMNTLWCYDCPNLKEVWLKTGQTIDDFNYNPQITTIKYI